MNICKKKWFLNHINPFNLAKSPAKLEVKGKDVEEDQNLISGNLGIMRASSVH